MELPIRVETRTGDTPAHKRARQIERPAGHPADHAGAACAASRPSRGACVLRGAEARRARRAAFAGHLEARRSFIARPRPAEDARAEAPAIGLSATVREPDDLRRYLVSRLAAPPRRDGLTPPPPTPPRKGEERGRRARRDASEGSDSLPLAGRARVGVKLRDGTPRRSRRRRGRRGARYPHARPRRAPAARGAHGGAVDAGDLRPHPRARDDARLRQHAHAGGVHVPGTLEAERRQPRHRAASRLARRGAAPQGRGGDGRGQAARGGLHVDARPRHRLGRRRSRRQCRRAEGREPADAAHRPLQPPHGRALRGLSRARQPLRDPGMPRRARRRARGGAGHAGRAHRRARRAGPARPRHGLRRAVRPRRALRRGALRGALRDLRWEDFEAVRRLRGDRRLRAAEL